MFAINEGHRDIVQRLVSAGADVFSKDKVCVVRVSVLKCCRYSTAHEELQRDLVNPS